jgi:hypothetical protein
MTSDGFDLSGDLAELFEVFAQSAADAAATYAKQELGVADFPGFIDYMFTAPNSMPLDAVAIKQLHSAWVKAE